MTIDKTTNQFGSIIANLLLNIQRDANNTTNFEQITNILLETNRWNLIKSSYDILPERSKTAFITDIQTRLETALNKNLNGTGSRVYRKADFVSTLVCNRTPSMIIDWRKKSITTSLFIKSTSVRQVLSDLNDQLNDVNDELSETSKRLAHPKLMLHEKEYKDYFLTHLYFNNYDKQPLVIYFKSMVNEKKRLSNLIDEQITKLADLRKTDELQKSGFKPQVVRILNYLPGFTIKDLA